MGRAAPAPVDDDGGRARLSVRFVEWLMGLEDGHVTDPAIGITRTAQLAVLGNGVVPQQAVLALTTLAGVAA